MFNNSKILVLMEFLIYYFFISLILINLPDLSRLFAGLRAYPKIISYVNSNEPDASLYKQDFITLYSAFVICALFVESVILVPVKRI